MSDDETVRDPGEETADDRLLSRAARQLDRARAGADGLRRSLLTPAGVRGAALEAAWIAGHIVMYPFGVSQEQDADVLNRNSVHDLPLAVRGLLAGDVEAAGTPILLVHGMVDNRSVFTLLRRSLRRRGFGTIASFNYNSMTGDIREVAERFGAMVERVCEQTEYERIHVVGHSLGGLVARYYVQRLGGDARVHTLVTLGSPHEGTVPARFIPHPMVRQLRPGSDLIRELAEPAAGCSTRFVCVWSDLDQLVVPARSGKIVHPDLDARNVFVRGVGHLSLPFDGQVVHEICTTLSHLDHEGQTVASGATSITSSSGRRPRAATPRILVAGPNAARDTAIQGATPVI